jgi:tellurite resistance protein TerC
LPDRRLDLVINLMHTNLWFWIAFNAGVLCMLAIDLFGFQRKAHAPSTKEAAIWTAVWVALSLGFNALIWYWEGPAKALEFLTGYLVEYSLSVDNIFVFVLVFSYFAMPAAYQHRVLFWGILSALIFRGVMIGVGVAFVERFHWALFLFGVFLFFTGINMFFSRKRAIDIARNPLIRLVRRLLPVSDTYHGACFTVLRDGRRLVTPLTLALIMIEITDILFAVDSIPAIFGITRDPFIVYTSNACAILGLRSLYFLLAGVVHKLVYLKPALAIILSFIGAKMLLADVYHIPTAASLGFVGLVLLAAIGLSLLVNRRRPAVAERATETDHHSPPVANLR